MLKSLMLAAACAYINPPGLQPNVPVLQLNAPTQAVAGMDMEFDPWTGVARVSPAEAFAMAIARDGLQGNEAAEANEAAGRPFWQLEQVNDDLCSKVSPEPVTDQLNAFIDEDAWHRADRPVGLPGTDADYAKYGA